MLRLKSKKRRVAFPITLMRFPCNRVAEQTEQKFRRIQDCQEKQTKIE